LCAKFTSINCTKIIKIDAIEIPDCDFVQKNLADGMAGVISIDVVCIDTTKYQPCAQMLKGIINFKDSFLSHEFDIISYILQ
jgi:hypothetical protein